MIDVTKVGLFQLVSSHLDNLNIPREHEIYDILALDLEVCAMGLIDYLFRKNK